MVSLLSDAALLFVPDACPTYLFLMLAAFVFFRVSSRASALTAARLTLLLPLHYDTLCMPRNHTQPQRLTLCAAYNLVCFRYVASAAGLNQSDPLYEHWKGVFEHFLPKEEEQPVEGDDVDRLIKSHSKHVTCHTCAHVTLVGHMSQPGDDVDRLLKSHSNVPLPPSAPEEKSLSKRRKKLMSRLRCVCVG